MASYRIVVVKSVIIAFCVMLIAYGLLYMNGFYLVHNDLGDCKLSYISGESEVTLSPVFAGYYTGFADMDGAIYRDCEGEDSVELLYVSDMGIFTKL